MKIRSITTFINPKWPLDEEALNRAGKFNEAARLAFMAADFEVQTTRLATIPFPNLPSSSVEADRLVEYARQMERTAKAFGFEYVSLGPALPQALASYALIPQVLASTKDVFLAGMMTLPNGGISLPAVRACATIIHQTAGLSADGFANLRFAALANVQPGAPFFPAAYHEGERPAFALAIEAADLAVEAFRQAPDLEQARQTLRQMIEQNAMKLCRTADQLAQQFPINFLGVDFTLAPFPLEALSFGTAMEQLGVPAVGLHGSLASASIVVDTLDQASFSRAGFNGLLLPVLEDATLAARIAEGRLTVKDLLLYSAVCGTGLDTIPLPGDTSIEQLYAVLLDVAALSQRLNKPLTARLMPIPGKQAGDLTDFTFDYFANSRVLALEAEPLKGFLVEQGSFNLSPRPR